MLLFPLFVFRIQFVRRRQVSRWIIEYTQFLNTAAICNRQTRSIGHVFEITQRLPWKPGGDRSKELGALPEINRIPL